MIHYGNGNVNYYWTKSVFENRSDLWAQNGNGYSIDELHCATHQDTQQIMMIFHVLLNFTILSARFMAETNCQQHEWNMMHIAVERRKCFAMARRRNRNWCDDKRCFDKSIHRQSSANTESIWTGSFHFSIEIYRFLIFYCRRGQFLLHFKQQSTFFCGFLP